MRDVYGRGGGFPLGCRNSGKMGLLLSRGGGVTLIRQSDFRMSSGIITVPPASPHPRFREQPGRLLPTSPW